LVKQRMAPHYRPGQKKKYNREKTNVKTRRRTVSQGGGEQVRRTGQHGDAIEEERKVKEKRREEIRGEGKGDLVLRGGEGGGVS